MTKFSRSGRQLPDHVREIEVQEAERRGLVAGDDEIEGDLRGLTEMARTRGGVDGLLAEYRITLDQWKEEARRTSLIQKLEDAEAARLPVTAGEIREEFTRNFWEGQGSPPDAVLAEHRDHMQGVIRRRKWAVHRREWLRPLDDITNMRRIARFQPRRRPIGSAAVGCKSLLAGTHCPTGQLVCPKVLPVTVPMWPTS